MQVSRFNLIRVVGPDRDPSSFQLVGSSANFGSPLLGDSFVQQSFANTRLIVVHVTWHDNASSETASLSSYRFRLAGAWAADTFALRPEAILLGDGVNYQRSPNTRNGWFAGACKRIRVKDKTFPEHTTFTS